MDFEAIIAEITPIVEQVIAYFSSEEFKAVIDSVVEFISGLMA